MANEKILVIDDSAQIRDFLSRQVLPRSGFVCITASDGRAGLEMLGKEKPDLILTDMQMPRLSGLEMLQLLSQHKVDIPVVLMTAHGSEMIAVEAFRLGVKDYLVKPFTVDEVLRVIERALSETRLKRERDTLTRNLASANQQLAQRVQEMAVLSRVRQAVSALLDPAMLMKRISEAAVFVSGANRGALSLVTGEKDDLRLSASVGFPQPLEGSSVSPKSLMASALRAATPLLLVGPQLNVEPYGRDAPPPLAFMATPIKAGDKAMGVLAVDRTQNNKPFTDSDARLLAALAEYATIALNNAHMFDEVKSGQGKLEAIINHTSDGIILLNERGEVELVNPAAHTLLGATIPEHARFANVSGNLNLVQMVNRVTATHRALTQEITGARGKVLNVGISPVPKIGMVIMLHDITMLKELERIRQAREQSEAEKLRLTFERYVSPTIVQLLQRQDADVLAQPEVRPVIALHAGIRNFSQLFEQLSAENIVQDILNRHFATASDIVTRHSGTIERFAGDSILAIFGWPQTNPDDPERAVLSAVELQQAFAGLNAEWQTTLGLHLELGIGLGQGNVVAAAMGSQQHQVYTVIGDAVTIALALGKQARGGDIFMSRAIFDALNAVPTGASFIEMEPLSLPGKAEPHEVVAVRLEEAAAAMTT
jgi:class 3 adenylate cyclase/DNA-binding response OmpR family regulator